MGFDVNAYYDDILMECELPPAEHNAIFTAEYSLELYGSRDKFDEYERVNNDEIEAIFNSISFFKKEKESISETFLNLMIICNKLAARSWAKLTVTLDEKARKASIVFEADDYLFMDQDMIYICSIFLSSSTVAVISNKQSDQGCVIVVDFDFTREQDKIIGYIKNLSRLS